MFFFVNFLKVFGLNNLFNRTGFKYIKSIREHDKNVLLKLRKENFLTTNYLLN